MLLSFLMFPISCNENFVLFKCSDIMIHRSSSEALPIYILFNIFLSCCWDLFCHIIRFSSIVVSAHLINCCALFMERCDLPLQKKILLTLHHKEVGVDNHLQKKPAAPIFASMSSSMCSLSTMFFANPSNSCAIILLLFGFSSSP